MSQDTPRTVLKSVAGWTLGPTLGRGGFGHVRKATHKIAKRDCAVKILPSLDFSQPLRRDDLLDAMEAQKEVIMLKVFGGLGLKGIVSLDLVKEKEGWKYLFLPLIPGVTSQLRSPLDLPTLIPLFRALMCNLHSLHAIGIIHEDLKPANLLMTAEGYPILADFGFATFSPNGKRKIGGGGTLDFLSPEKVEGSPYYGRPSDVWACGILLYKWLTNKHPYIHSRSDDTDEVIEQRIMDEEPDLSALEDPKLIAAVPSLIYARHLILGMLNKDPRQRWSIPAILDHPFLNPPTIKESSLERITIPKLSDKPVSDPKPEILDEVIFLAYTTGEWVMCQSDRRIREKLAAPEAEPRWEKKMYHALNSWKARDPDDVGLPEGEVSVRAKPRMKSLERVMSQLEVSGGGPSKTAATGGNGVKAKNRLSLDFPTIVPRTKNEDSVLTDTTNLQQAPEIIVHAPKKVDKKPAPTKKAKTLVPAPVIQKPARHRSKGPEVSDSEEDGHSEVEDENDDEEDEKYLPAPMPPVKVMLRRSPRLAGKSPEMSGLPYQAAARRTKPGQ